MRRRQAVTFDGYDIECLLKMIRALNKLTVDTGVVATGPLVLAGVQIRIAHSDDEGYVIEWNR